METWAALHICFGSAPDVMFNERHLGGFANSKVVAPAASSTHEVVKPIGLATEG